MKCIHLSTNNKKGNVCASSSETQGGSSQEIEIAPPTGPAFYQVGESTSEEERDAPVMLSVESPKPKTEHRQGRDKRRSLTNSFFKFTFEVRPTCVS